MDYGKFEDVMATVADVFATWDDNMKDFTNVAREGGPTILAKTGTSADSFQFPGRDRRNSSRSRSILRTLNYKNESPTFELSGDPTNSSG